MLTNIAVGMTPTEEMFHAYMTNTIVLLEGALVTENKADRPTTNALKGSTWLHSLGRHSMICRTE